MRVGENVQTVVFYANLSAVHGYIYIHVCMYIFIYMYVCKYMLETACVCQFVLKMSLYIYEC